MMRPSCARVLAAFKFARQTQLAREPRRRSTIRLSLLAVVAYNISDTLGGNIVKFEIGFSSQLSKITFMG
jgi:hypothetical protein